MKRLLSLFVLVLVFSFPAMADSTPIHVNLGSLQLDLPFQTVNGVALWDFVHKQGDAGIMTPFGSWKNFVFNFGAITSISGHGAPFLDADYLVKSPAENFIPISNLKPGVFGGYDFNAQVDPVTGKKKPWIIGLKVSAAIW